MPKACKSGRLHKEFSFDNGAIILIQHTPAGRSPIDKLSGIPMVAPQKGPPAVG